MKGYQFQVSPLGIPGRPQYNPRDWEYYSSATPPQRSPPQPRLSFARTVQPRRLFDGNQSFIRGQMFSASRHPYFPQGGGRGKPTVTILPRILPKGNGRGRVRPQTTPPIPRKRPCRNKQPIQGKKSTASKAQNRTVSSTTASTSKRNASECKSCSCGHCMFSRLESAIMFFSFWALHAFNVLIR